MNKRLKAEIEARSPKALNRSNLEEASGYCLVQTKIAQGHRLPRCANLKTENTSALNQFELIAFPGV